MTLSKRKIRRNTFYGMASVVLPTLVMFIAYPVLIDGIGLKALGVYFIATSLSGIWGALDLGVAASSVKLVPEEIRQGRPENAMSIFISSLIFYLLLGCLAATILWFSSPALAILLKVENSLQQDAVSAFRIESIKFAVFFLSLAFISFLKGLEDFSYSAYLMTFLSIATYGGAAIGVTYFEAGLVDICLIGLAATIGVLLTSIYGVCQAMPMHGLSFRQIRLSSNAFKRIIGYAPYLAINALSVSSLTLLQRILISSLIGPAAVSAFAIATTLFRRGQVVLLSTFEALTPSVAGISTSDSLRETRLIYLKMLRLSGVLAMIGASTAYFFIEPIAAWWLGDQIKDEVTQMVKILAIAGFVYGAVPPAYHLLNGMGFQRLNTGFMLFVPGLFLLAVIGFSVDGFVAMDVIYAHAVAVIGHTFFFIAYVERVTWVRLLATKS